MILISFVQFPTWSFAMQLRILHLTQMPLVFF